MVGGGACPAGFSLHATPRTIWERASSVRKREPAALAGALIGVALAALTREAFGSVVALVQGLPWNQQYNFGIAAAVVAGIVLLVVIACLVSSRQYQTERFAGKNLIAL